jgi:hypothetical protein
MAVAFQSSSTLVMAGRTTTDDMVFTKPTGLAVGDLMFVHIMVNTGVNVTAASGFTLLRSTVGDLVMKGYWKIADSSDVAASSFTFQLVSDSDCCGIMYRISGADQTTPIGAETGSTTTNTATPSLAGITPPANSLLLVAFTAFGTSGTISSYAIATSNPSWTESLDTHIAGEVWGSAYGGPRSAATATGNFTATDDSADATNGWTGQIIAIAPAPSSVFFPQRRNTQAINRASTY